MAKHYLDNITFNSKSQGVNESISIRDTEARALIQTNANAIAEVTAKEAKDRVDINKNKSDIAKLNSAVERIDQKDTQQDNRLDDIETKNNEQDNRLTTAETEITNLDARMESAENNISALDTRVTATETKNTEQDGRLDRVEEKNTEQDNRITKNESDIASLDERVTVTETDITDIKAKDEEQDAHLTELDDKVAASTYEAGIGIYFGQGKVHTNINVEDEILDQINQNTIDIDVLKKRKSGSVICTNGYSYYGVDESGAPKMVYIDGNKFEGDVYVGHFDGGMKSWPEDIRPNSPNYGIYIEPATDNDDKSVGLLKVSPTFLTADPFKSPTDYKGLYNFVLTDDFMYDISTPTKFDDDETKSTYEVHNLYMSPRGCLYYDLSGDEGIEAGSDFAEQFNRYIKIMNARKAVDGRVDVPLMVEYTLSDGKKYSTAASVDLDSLNTTAKIYIPVVVVNVPFVLVDTYNISTGGHTFNRYNMSPTPERAKLVAFEAPDGYTALSIE